MPNRNAYLAVGFDDDARGALAELQESLVASVAAMADGGVSFEQMALRDLHMTFFFAGEGLRGLSGEQVQRWHRSAVDAIGRQYVGATGIRELRMTPSGLDLFPPEKRNLIVARFDVSESLRALQADVTSASTGLGLACSGSVRQQLAGSEHEWAPHVTLGKIRAPKGTVANIGREAIRVAWGTAATRLHRGIVAEGLELRGEQPKQGGYLDWNTPLRFSF
jgi:2'-5' RNA ligase